MTRVMVIGAGDLGRRVLAELGHLPGDCEIAFFGRDPDGVLRAANSAALCALQRGHAHRIETIVGDVTDLDRTSQSIDTFCPDVIFLAVSLQPWWVISELPPPAFRRLRAANFGPWLPMHLVPVLHAMEAVHEARSTATVVNAAFPDAVHPVLSARRLAPDVGIGNVANNVPGLRLAASAALGLPVTSIDVRLVAHHYVSHRLSRTGDSGDGAMILRVVAEGEDVTDRLDIAALLSELPGRYRRLGGKDGQTMTVASAMSVLVPLIRGGCADVHAPGPQGRPGGYPVRIDDGRIRLLLPPGVSEDEAHAVNLRGQRADGIAAIDADGTVTFEERAIAVLSDELGYACTRMRLADAPDCATELAERFAAYRLRVHADPGYSVAGSSPLASAQ